MNRVGSMFTPFFTDRPVTDYTTAATSNTKRFAAFFHGMLKRGVYIPPSQFEAWFVSAAHGEAEIAKTLEAARGAMQDAAAVK
jgi:glutamate-1-semialdehyde 2,1-aminomutase